MLGDELETNPAPSLVDLLDDDIDDIAAAHHVLDVRDPAGADVRDVEQAVGALLQLDDPLLLGHRVRIAELAAKSRLPAIYGFREIAEAGGLMSYGANLQDLYRRSATYLDKIFKGAKPADLPVEQPTKFDFVVNMKTAKALGMTIPPGLLLRAELIQ